MATPVVTVKEIARNVWLTNELTGEQVTIHFSMCDDLYYVDIPELAGIPFNTMEQAIINLECKRSFTMKMY